MYKGEIQLSEEQLKSFLKTGESLKINGKQLKQASMLKLLIYTLLLSQVYCPPRHQFQMRLETPNFLHQPPTMIY